MTNKDQKLLDLISSSFSSTLNSPLLSQHLQSLKKHLYNRSFAQAFPTSSGIEDTCAYDQTSLLEAYIVRWVPTRVLCYSRVFDRIAKFLPKSELLRLICIGAGCGSETLALQAVLTCQCTFEGQ